MVHWRRLTATFTGAVLAVGTLALAPVLAQDAQDASLRADAAEGGRIEIFGQAGPSASSERVRVTVPAEDGPWVGVSSAGTNTDPVFGIKADGSLHVVYGSGLSVPAALMGEQVTSVSTGAGFAAATTGDGELYLWGSAARLQLPMNRFLAPAELGGAAVRAEAASNGVSILLDNGRVRHWHLNTGIEGEFITTDGTPEEFGGTAVEDAVGMSRDSNGTYTARADGSVSLSQPTGNFRIERNASADPVATLSRTSWVTASGEAESRGALPAFSGTPLTVAKPQQGNNAVWVSDQNEWRFPGATTLPGIVEALPDLQGTVPIDLQPGQYSVRAVVTDGGPQLPALEVTAEPSVTGTAQVGQTLTATPATFNETEGVTLSHQWYADGEPIDGATGVTYVLDAADEGAMITYVTTATRAADGAVLASDPSPAVGPVEAGFAIIGEPGITGSPVVGERLTALTAQTNRPEGRPMVSLQWQVGDGENFENVAGSTSATFLLTEAHVGQYVRYIQTSRLGSGETATAESVVVGPVSEPLGEFTVEEQPTIEGDTQVGETITATPATFSDTEGVTVEHQWYADDTLIEGANGPTLTLDQSHEGAMISYATKGARTIDGAEATSDRTEAVGPVVPVELVVTGQPTITGQPFIGEELTVTPAPVTDDRAEITYQWYVGEGEEFTPIEGATETTLELTEDLRDQHVLVEQIARRSLDGARASAESIVVGPITDAPVELTVETEAGLTGTPRVGQTLTGTPATFSTTEGVTVTNYWVIGDQEIEADGTTLVLTDDHVRQNIQFKSVATRGDEAVPSVSPTVGPVLVVLAPTAKPTIAGTPQVGQTLTGTPATFNDTQGVTVANRWLANGEPINGATSTTFTLTEAQFGQVITFESTATRGADTANSVSDPTGAVTRAPLTVTSPPSISGDARVGQTLTGTPAVYSATAGVTITNRWLADGEPIDGATGTTLELTGEHLGRTITFESIAQRADEEPVSSVSGPTGPVLPEEDQEPSGEVVIDLDGPTAPGSTIRVSVGTDFAGQQVQLYLSNLDRLLGGVTVDEDGFIEVKVPGDIPLGEHTLAVYDANGDLIGWDDFSVTLERPEDPALQDAITVTPDTVQPGQEVVITVGADRAGQMVRVVMFSAPRDLGFFQVAADGTIRVQIPSDVTPGEHRIAVYDADGNLIGWQDITVAGDPATGGGAGSGTGRGMGNFGADSPEYLAPLGLAILLAGAVTAGAGWRRRQQLS